MANVSRTPPISDSCPIRELGREIVLKTVKKMKFSDVVRPAEVIHLSLTVAAEGAVAYTYRKREKVCASAGMMEF